MSRFIEYSLVFIALGFETYAVISADVCAIRSSQWLDDPAGISGGKNIRRDIASDYAPCSNYRVITDMDAWQNHYVGRHPHIVADHNRTANDVVKTSKIMSGRDHRITKTKAAVAAENDRRVIDHQGVRPR